MTKIWIVESRTEFESPAKDFTIDAYGRQRAFDEKRLKSHDLARPIGDIISEGQPAAKWVKTVQRYCLRNNPESYLRKNLLVYDSVAYRSIKGILSELPDSFYTKNIFDAFPFLKGWTSGDKIREACGLLICHGTIRKDLQKTEKSVAYKYINQPQDICPFLDVKEGKQKCIFDWDKFGKCRDDFPKTTVDNSDDLVR